MRVSPVLNNSYSCTPIRGNNEQKATFSPNFGAQTRLVRQALKYPDLPLCKGAMKLTERLMEHYKKIGDDIMHFVFKEDLRYPASIQISASYYPAEKDLPKVLERCKATLKKEDYLFYKNDMNAMRNTLAGPLTFDYNPPGFGVGYFKNISNDEYFQMITKNIPVETPQQVKETELYFLKCMLQRPEEEPKKTFLLKFLELL